MVLGQPLVESGAASDAATRRVPRASPRRGVANPRVGTSIFGSPNSAQRRVERTCEFATWNVRSLLNEFGPVETASARSSGQSTVMEYRRIDIIVDELSRLKIEVGGLQETRWFGREVYSVGDAIVLSSGRPVPQEGESLRRGEGVAIVLRGRALQAWRAGGSQWQAVSPRIAVARLRMTVKKNKSLSIHVVVCYAPTFRSSRDVKDIFFDDLQRVLRSLKRHDDHLVLLGDFNARVGSSSCQDSDEWADVRGPCGFGECNSAGEELMSFLSLNQLTICNTWFTKRSQYLQTWQHPNTKRWHAIDFVVTRQRDRRLCRDCRVVCTADCGSDHRMVCLTLELPHASFSRQKSAPKRPRFDVSKFKPSPLSSAEEKEHVLQLVQDFQDSLSCSLKAADYQESSSIEEIWTSISNSLLDAGREHLGYTHKRQPDWFDENRTVLLPMIKERRLLHQRWVESGETEDYAKFKTARSEARAAVRRAKNNWLANVAKQAELGRASRQSGSTWPAIRSIQRCFQGLRPVPVLGIKNEDGTSCESVEDQTKRWQRHFTKILNVESEVDMTEQKTNKRIVGGTTWSKAELCCVLSLA